MCFNLSAARILTRMADYKVQFEVFEGPLDLLLYLVKKEEVDIYQVNLTKLATDFLEYVELMRELDLDIAGEFLVMAATLMYIKSRELLPRDQQVTDDLDLRDEEDPRWELIRRLVEYKKFKDAALRLQELEWRQELIYRRQATSVPVERSPVRTEVSIFDLIAGVNSVLKRLKEREPSEEVVGERWTVTEKIELLRAILADRQQVRFLELFSGSVTRAEVVVTFLALLELMRLGVARAVQTEPFGEIEIMLAPKAESSPEPSANARDENQPKAMNDSDNVGNVGSPVTIVPGGESVT